MVEAILCLFEQSLVSKRVRFTPPQPPQPPQPPPPPPTLSAVKTNGGQRPRQLQEAGDEERTVPGAEPCRACSKFAVIRDTLLDSGCIAPGDDGGCRCRPFSDALVVVVVVLLSDIVLLVLMLLLVVGGGVAALLLLLPLVLLY